MVIRPDYSDLVNIKTEKQKKKEYQEATILADIDKIKEVIASDDRDNMRDFHIYLDGKYSPYVPNFGKSAYGYDERLGFIYDYIGDDGLKHNLTLFKARLEGYLCEFPQVNQFSTAENNINVNINNSNEMKIDIKFEEAKQKIEDMPGLNDPDTEEIKSKIDDLESISKENLSKKKKWEKVKPILLFALDKGADVAITIMGLILQMQLGM